ncbi:hypothetical protein NLJ89_g10880 [Agrocybe chaxingu]|uniref:Uncharacterized protein n=1 Tax=Agrocybe chaxingu TaxID=84603 RepID=A0A9W8JQY6_9AGAR|nr:hypothetical protein NLJ89_g10880 [Agrocybe chaxingu]
MASDLNPRTTHYEFLGPPGAFLISIGVPIASYGLYFGCSESAGGCPPPLSFSALSDSVIRSVSNLDWWKDLWDTDASLLYLGWYAFCVVAWAILPGDAVDGTTLRTGGKLSYKINAFSTFLLALGITSGWILRNGPESFTFIYHKWVGLLTASLVMSVVQAVYVYVASFKPGKLLALGGNSGNFIYDELLPIEIGTDHLSFELAHEHVRRANIDLSLHSGTSDAS